MRQKNIERAAEALFLSQGDDKNKVLASLIPDSNIRSRVKDMGRAMLILERMVLPTGKFSFTKDEIYDALLGSLQKKGHRIQDNDEPDTEEFAKEKEQARIERLAKVDNVLGKRISDLPQEEEGKDTPMHRDEFGQIHERTAEPLRINVGEVPVEVKDSALSEFALDLIAQAYKDGIRSALSQMKR